jgi:hypothetical protein
MKNASRVQKRIVIAGQTHKNIVFESFVDRTKIAAVKVTSHPLIKKELLFIREIVD